MGSTFGPVLSRRLGLSMGVDLLRYKTCNLDCIYCELGKTICLTTDRGRFASPEKILREISARSNEPFDHLTFAGSGEPTLSIDLGEILRKSKSITDVPVAVITNSTLLINPVVRREIAAADIVLPSLDAATKDTFSAINKPAKGLDINDIIDGLRKFRKEFSGEIWLEIMLVKDLNDREAELIAEAAASTQPDRIQLNTVVRPPAELVSPLTENEMKKMLVLFPGAELIPDWNWSVPSPVKSRIIDLLGCCSCTLSELCTTLNLVESDAIKYCSILERDGMIFRLQDHGELHFRASIKSNVNNI